jgi:fermentation-respiration switch protein FrsA (DUF1100 family)
MINILSGISVGLAVILVLSVILVYWLFQLAFKRQDKLPKLFCDPNNPQNGIVYDWAWLNSHVLEERKIISSHDEILLNGHFLRSQSNSHRYFITFHGFKGNFRELSAMCHFVYDEFDMNILMVDERAHNGSGGKYITMGYLEKYDALDWIKHICKKDPDAQICLYGISMGASIIMAASGLPEFPQNVRCIIEDSGFSSIYKEYQHICRCDFAINTSFVLPAFEKLAKKIIGIDFHHESPVEMISRSKTPTLFIHGDKDTFVPFKMLDENFRALPDSVPKEKYVTHGVAHCLSYFIYPDEYKNRVVNFIRKYAY